MDRESPFLIGFEKRAGLTDLMGKAKSLFTKAPIAAKAPEVVKKPSALKKALGWGTLGAGGGLYAGSKLSHRGEIPPEQGYQG